MYIFVHRIYIVSVATKDPGKGYEQISNIFILMWGAMWVQFCAVSSILSQRLAFGESDRAPRQQNNTKTDPNDHLVTKEAK